jgi:preprotein translocase subunit SecE
MSDKVRWYKRLTNFLRDVKSELKKVTWPSRPEVTNTTVVVIVATVVIGFYLFFWDLIAAWLIGQARTLFQ